MRSFDYRWLEDCLWDGEVVSLLSQIHEYKGRQDLFVSQRPSSVARLVDIAKVQSVESSNRIEGIVTTKARIRSLVADKTMPRNRDEEEIMGYRDVLNTVHENYEYIDLTRHIVLQLHRDFESRIALLNTSLSAKDRIKIIISSTIGKITKSGILEKQPDIAVSTVEKALKELVEDGFIERHGVGRSTFYVKVSQKISFHAKYI